VYVEISESPLNLIHKRQSHPSSALSYLQLNGLAEMVFLRGSSESGEVTKKRLSKRENIIVLFYLASVP